MSSSAACASARRKRASSVSIDCIDTAMDYSQSQAILSKINISNISCNKDFMDIN